MADEMDLTIVDENDFQKREKWFFWSHNSSWEISSTISVDTNDSLADISVLNGERESETNSEGDSSWHDDGDGKTACGRLGRQTSARTKTSARLKITFVDMTFPGQRPEPLSLSPHFLLSTVNCLEWRQPRYYKATVLFLLILNLYIGKYAAMEQKPVLYKKRYYGT